MNHPRNTETLILQLKPVIAQKCNESFTKENSSHVYLVEKKNMKCTKELILWMWQQFLKVNVKSTFC